MLRARSPCIGCAVLVCRDKCRNGSEHCSNQCTEYRCKWRNISYAHNQYTSRIADICMLPVSKFLTRKKCNSHNRLALNILRRIGRTSEWALNAVQKFVSSLVTSCTPQVCRGDSVKEKSYPRVNRTRETANHAAELSHMARMFARGSLLSTKIAPSNCGLLTFNELIFPIVALAGRSNPEKREVGGVRNFPRPSL
jgi:hypothetical protein